MGWARAHPGWSSQPVSLGLRAVQPLGRQRVPPTLPASGASWVDSAIWLHREYGQRNRQPCSARASGSADRPGTQRVGCPVQGLIGESTSETKASNRSSLVSGAVGTPAGEPCVAVIGMHRSGTSATAGLLISLGLSGPAADDLVPGSSSNERGHWESREVIRCNTETLAPTRYSPASGPLSRSRPGTTLPGKYDVLRSDGGQVVRGVLLRHTESS